MRISTITPIKRILNSMPLRWFGVRQKIPSQVSDGRLGPLSLGLLVVAGWLLGACAARPDPVSPEVSKNGSIVGPTIPKSPQQDLTLVDDQGAVEVAVSPKNSNGGSNDTLVFEVTMNTHSVDLPLNLTELSSLETDKGSIVFATAWSGGGGHHVRGLLEFPVETPDGSEILEGASQIILTIRDIDAEQRVFTWALPLSN
jgi:hypothetical protein